MSQVRDWLASLHRASYKGTPFWFESDDEEGGLGLVVNEFPYSDIPFIEDLGENARHYGGHAYVHGDDADAQAAALIAACVSHGPGALVVPLFGAVTVRLLSFKRRHEKDKLGFVAFEVRFVREGAPAALISVAALANAAIGAIDALTPIAANNFAAGIDVSGRPDFVITAAADGVAMAAAALDTARTSNAVEPIASAVVRDQLSDIVAASAEAITDTPSVAPITALASSLVQAARDLGDAISPPTAVGIMASIADAFPTLGQVIFLSPSQAMAAANAAAAARLARLAALSAFADAIVARSYTSRQDGVTARAQVSARFQAELEACDGAADAALTIAMQNVRDAVIDYLTTLINDLKPVVTVVTASSLPSLVLAWRLYVDPLRGDELVARNHVRHPSFMPQEFAARAP